MRSSTAKAYSATGWSGALGAGVSPREAARAAISFAFERLGLGRLRSGHAFDNPASGLVLRKLGFEPTGETRVWSRPRGQEIAQLTYALGRPAAA